MVRFRRGFMYTLLCFEEKQHLLLGFSSHQSSQSLPLIQTDPVITTVLSSLKSFDFRLYRSDLWEKIHYTSSMHPSVLRSVSLGIAFIGFTHCA